MHKIFKIIIGYSALFFTKLVLFYRHNVEYIFFIKICIGVCLLYNFLYYQYSLRDNNVKKNNDLLLYQDIVANFLIPSLTIELYENSNATYLFCSKVQTIPTISIRKFRLSDQDIFCNTRIIKEKIDELLPNYISYKIYIDNIAIVNGIDDSTKLFKVNYYNIDSKGKNLLKVELSIDPHSSYITKVRNEIMNRVLYVLYVSSFFMLCLVIIIVPFIKKYKKIKEDTINLSKESIKLNIIKNARKNIQILTNKFHKYYEKNHNNYEPYPSNCFTGLPIPLISAAPSSTKQVFEAETKKVIEVSDFLIKEYGILHSYDIKFTSDVVTNKVEVPFEQELFDQIIIGIISNLLLFIKSNKHNYHIHLIIDKKTILFAHDVFNIDETMMIEYSKMIFQETLNPYILTFGQIITLLDVYDLHCKVYNEFSKKIIKIELKEENRDQNNVIFLPKKRTV